MTEEFLRILFGQFGTVIDVSIKKSMIDQEMGRQSGYGFVHFALNRAGVSSAVKAVEALTVRRHFFPLWQVYWSLTRMSSLMIV